MYLLIQIFLDFHVIFIKKTIKAFVVWQKKKLTFDMFNLIMNH